MNTSADDGNNHLRYAEYVLGVLDADARAAVAHEIANPAPMIDLATSRQDALTAYKSLRGH